MPTDQNLNTDQNTNNTVDNQNKNDGNPTNGDISNDDLIKKMVSHGLQDDPNASKGDLNAGSADDNNGDGKDASEKIEIDGKEYSTDELKSIVGEVSNLKETVNRLKDGDANVDREVSKKLLEYLEKQGKPTDEVPKPPTQEEIDAFKEEYDKKAADDYTSTTMEIAGSVARTVIKPIGDKVNELVEKVEKIVKASEQATADKSKQMQAFGHIESAFKSAERPVSKEAWGNAIKFYRDNFGIDLISQAYTNPEGLKKQLTSYLKSIPANGGNGGHNVDQNNRMHNLPAGGGSGVGGEQKNKTDVEKTTEKLKNFGLIE